MALTYLHIPAGADAQRAARFYEAVCGWKIDDRGGGDFRFGDDAAQLIGRFLRDSSAPPVSGIVPYFTVADVRGAVARVPDRGGTVLQEPNLEGDTLIARLRDPAGNEIGIWQFAH
jgi:predicted enzyme related to lactoylglutathione lyase